MVNFKDSFDLKEVKLQRKHLQATHMHITSLQGLQVAAENKLVMRCKCSSSPFMALWQVKLRRFFFSSRETNASTCVIKVIIRYSIRNCHLDFMLIDWPVQWDWHKLKLKASSAHRDCNHLSQYRILFPFLHIKSNMRSM